MDEFRKQLEENADEAEFALLIDDYLNDLGEALQNKYEEAKQRGEAPEMPEDMKNRLRQFIANYNEPIETNADSIEIIKDDVPSNNQKIRLSAKWLRRLGVAAATIAILVGSMLTVQAAGFDVFGAIARWTESVFSYEQTIGSVNSNSMINSSVEQLKYSLLAQGLSQENTPAWVPDRFEITEMKAESNESRCIIHALFSSESDYLIIDISRSSTGDEVCIEKNTETVETVVVSDKTFYVFQNNSNMAAVWSDGNDSISIYGTISKEELISIVLSIGEEEK